jgi:hypothetical protein
MIIPSRTRWEFRLSDDGYVMAFWDPGNEPWFVPVANMQGRFYGPVELDTMKDHNGRKIDWVRFLPTDRAAREVLQVVAEWAEGEPADSEAVGRLAFQLGRKGYRIPEPGEEDDE